MKVIKLYEAEIPERANVLEGFVNVTIYMMAAELLRRREMSANQKFYDLKKFHVLKS